MQPDFTTLFQDEEHHAFTWHGIHRSAALLVHGFPGTPAEMHPVAQLLHEQGWTVHAPLLPGFGPELATLRDKTHDDWLNSLRRACQTLQRSHDRLLLVGNSMGAALCMQLALEYRPCGLILFAPFWQIDHVLWHMLPVLKYVIPRFKPFALFKPDFASPETRKGIANFMPGVNLDDPAVQAGILNFEIPTGMIDQIRIAGQKGQAAAGRITCPVLVLQGLEDELVRPATTRQLIRHFSGGVRYTEVRGTHELLNPAHDSWATLRRLMTDFVHEIVPENRTHA
ncbi:MAG: alpha/beta fold hydrolase [Anaerolineae bacterium]|nr:alpha/beta fold hydrolase [Anaerolineae bacterium]